MSNDNTHTWALANFLATPEEIKTNIYENLQTVEQQDRFEEQGAQSLVTAEIVSSQSQDTHSADKTIISDLVKQDRKRLAKQDVMPTWAATHLTLAVKHT